MNFWEAREAALSGKRVECFIEMTQDWREYFKSEFEDKKARWNAIQFCAEWRIMRDPEVHEFEARSYYRGNATRLGAVVDPKVVIEFPDVPVAKNKLWKVRVEEIIE